ncbi:MAG TPA: ammonia-forming cytochrome c nitrite reductase subunit c552 [Candidatus Polarisedimenticolaceae bacterium]|nr:ammonia-forming cytochrome c nitrite reductase subunit c552 [Candidatus Polarisedimenticolaceae bacterium]
MHGTHIIGFTLLLSAWPGFATVTAALNEECRDCHDQRVGHLAASAHAALACASCHEGAAGHVIDPASVLPRVHFDLELCGACHTDQYGTYTYGDDWKTLFGGSPEGWSKLNDFSHYNDIIDGYGFTREYNEERSHNVMLEDHHDVTRGKKETCLQCKSTKVAYYWDSDAERTIEQDTFVFAGHMTQGLLVPAGTTVAMRTDRAAPRPKNHEVQVLVTLPDGTRYASFDYPGASADGTWLWAALYALTVNELPAGSPTRLSGNGCNHCHDPHRVGRDPATGELVGFRIIRKALLDAIARRGINPYAPASPTVFDGDTPLSLDEGIALCAQCHVEYVCGNSPIDGIDRDYFPWAKASELEQIYSTEFPGWGDHAEMKYIQDWVHGAGALSSTHAPANGVPYLTPAPIGVELIKSQHPEAETYWGSRHYGNAAQCFVCHMPKVTRVTDGTRFTSHWMASPLKYMSPAPVADFAAAFALQVEDGIIPPCAACHSGNLARMKTKAERIQSDTYNDARTVESALVSSLAAIKGARDALAAGQSVDPVLFETAIADHRAAHVRWENLVVSENSMGFHNPNEVAGELSVALVLAQSARQRALDGTNCAAGCGPSSGSVPDGGWVAGVPLTIGRNAAGELELSWGASCVSTDEDFAIYEGTLGQFTSHVPRQCSTGGATSAVVEPSAGSSYYVVLPHNTIWEGSHGYRSTGSERPRGSSNCLPQAVGVCR